MTISTRPATVNDAACVANSHVKSWQSAYQGIISQAYLDAINFEKHKIFWKSNFSNLTDNRIAIVLCNKNKVIGFVMGEPKNADMCFLHALYIHPEHTGKSYGVHLMNAFKQACITKGYKTLNCGVLTENVNARKFYEKNGGKHKAKLAHTWACPDGNDYAEETYYFDLT